MCGIIGVVGKRIERDTFISMVNSLHYRGPNDAGVYQDEYINFGHRRLSIIDLSQAGRQPMYDSKKELMVVFNGEIYNYIELKEILKNEFQFCTSTDTEIILAAYSKWGDACVEHFNGMFSFALWDFKKKRLFCARDRLGIKPFYYCLHEGAFYFASEQKPFFIGGVPRNANEKIIFQYLAYGYYHHSEETFFTGVYALTPGSQLIYENGKITIRSYWVLSKHEEFRENITEQEAVEELRYLINRSIQLRLRSDVPIGLHVSGGLDSSTLLVMMDALMNSSCDLHAYTVIFGDERYDEKVYVDKIRNMHNAWVFHSVLFDKTRLWELADECLYHIEAPYGGLATLSYFYMNKVSHNDDVTVLLEGQGVDEILAGYPYYQNCNDTNAATTECYQDGTRFLHPECIRNSAFYTYDKRPYFDTPFTNTLNAVLYRDMRFTKLPRVLCFNDRATMAFSKELRVPFLDHIIVEFCFSLPSYLKIHNNVSKYLLRRAMKGIVPDPIRKAPKRAVVNPQREWLRKDYSADILDIFHSRSFRERSIWDAVKVIDVYNKFCNGEGDNSFFVWQYINMELWFRQFIDKPFTSKYVPDTRDVLCNDVIL